MRKIFASLAALPVAMAMPGVAADASVLGPDAALCSQSAGPALLVKVTGFKGRGGTVRVRTFPGATKAAWFDKKRALRRTLVALPDSGSVEICMAVPRAGPYVVDVRHDINGNSDTDRADGAGVSGNPNVSLFDFFLGKKPAASQVVVNAGGGITMVPITMKYIQGGSFKPIKSAS